MNGAAIWAIMAAEARRLVRDRLGLFFILVLPVLVIVVVGATIGGASRHVPLGVIDGDGSAPSQEVVSRLRRSESVDVTVYTSRSDLERDLRTSKLLAGLTIAAGFGASAGAGRDASVEVLAVQTQGAQTAAPIVQSVIDGVGADLAAAAFVGRINGLDPPAAAAAVARTASGLATVEVAVRSVGKPLLDNGNQFSYTAPSNLVLFVFIISLTAGGALVEARRLGVTRRMLAAPVGTGSIILGFAAMRLALSLFQAGLVVVIGALVFDVDWGDPLGVAALIAVYSCVGAGAALTVGAVARSPEQAQAVGVPLGIGLGMLGGAMWPLDVVPDTLRTVGHLTPQAWAMDGFVGLVYDGKGIAGIAPQLGVLAVYAVVLGVAGTLLLRRSLTRSG